MEELIMKIRKEQYELINKIKKLTAFRGTDEWNNISINQKLLLDVQLQAMKTYLECLSARIVDLKSCEDTTKEETDKEPSVKVIKIVLNNEKD